MRKRDTTGQTAPTARPESEWLRIERPELRIVSEEEWDAVQRRLVSARADYARQTRSRRQYQRDQDSKYLLTGFGRCHVCGGGMHVRSRGQNGGRFITYACSSHYRQGPTICEHVEQWPMNELDRAVLDTLVGELDAVDVERIIAIAREAQEATTTGDLAKQLQRELATVEREQARMADAIAASGQIPALVDRLKTTEAKRRALSAQLERARQTAPAPAWRDVEQRDSRTGDRGCWATSRPRARPSGTF